MALAVFPSCTISLLGKSNGKYLPRPLLFEQGELLTPSPAAGCGPCLQQQHARGTGSSPSGSHTPWGSCARRQLPITQLQLWFQSRWCEMWGARIQRAAPTQPPATPVLTLPQHQPQAHSAPIAARCQDLAQAWPRWRRGSPGRQGAQCPLPRVEQEEQLPKVMGSSSELGQVLQHQLRAWHHRSTQE